MKKCVLIGLISALVGLIDSGMLPALGGGEIGLAQEPEPFSQETQGLLKQYDVLKTQFLALIETVKNLREERQSLIEQEKALKEALEDSKKAKTELDDQYIPLLETVRNLQDDRRKLMTDQTVAQKMASALKARVEALERRQAELESELNESEQTHRTERAKLKEASKKIKNLAKALNASEQANIDLQLQVADLLSLSRESRLAFNYELGRLYARHGEYEGAISEFQKTLELNPNYAEAYRGLGEIYREHLERADLASPYFRRYLELRPEAADFEQIKGWLIKTKREIDTRNAARQWGGGFFRNLGRIFF